MKFRISHKIAVISFKTIHNMGPASLSNLINIQQCSRYNLRSIVGVILQDQDDFDMFKRLIKTHYFKEANSDLS